MASGETELPAEGHVVAGKYRLERLLGRGGMGAVFEATHTITGRRLAIKRLVPELADEEAAVSRFLREARAAGGLEHPNVVAIHDVGEDDGAPFLVMERLRGEPLSALMARGPLSPERILAVLLPAMRGIAAAHAQGVLHRDLKPDNVFVCEGPAGEPREPKVLDFGISKLLDTGERPLSVTLTQPGTLLGTPQYMAPEQLEGRDDLDARVDVYALGVVLYEALAGRLPFDAAKLPALVLQVARGEATPLAELRSDLDPELAAVVEQAMAADREARFADVPALARALEPFAGGARFDPTSPGGAASSRDGAARDDAARDDAARGRTYSDAEVEEILRRAIERDLQTGGLEHEDLVAAAREVGIDEAAIDSVVRQMERERRAAEGRAGADDDATDDAKQDEEQALVPHDDIERRARRKLELKRRRFRRHLGVYAIFGVFFFAIDLADGGSGWWFHWPLIGWGVAVALQAFGAYSARLDELVEDEREKRERREKRRARKKAKKAGKAKGAKGADDAQRPSAPPRALDRQTIDDGVEQLLEAARRSRGEGPRARVEASAPSRPGSDAQEQPAEGSERELERRRRS